MYRKKCVIIILIFGLLVKILELGSKEENKFPIKCYFNLIEL
jgi:hypothetical protein